MGCIFSCFQRNNGPTETLFFATKYCHNCDTQFNNYNNYNKHIINCNKINGIFLRFKEENIEEKNGDL